MKNEMNRFEKWYPIIVMLAISLAFAIGNIFLKKIGSDGVDHVVFITYRQTISAVFLSPLAFFLERGSRPKLTQGVLWYIFASALIGASLAQYLFLLGLEYTSATFACAFLNMVPVVTFLMALPFGLESLDIKHRSGRAKVFGALVCVGGAILLTVYKGMPLFHFSHPEVQIGQHNNNPNLHVVKERWAMGPVALFAGTLCLSSWFVLQSKIGKRYPCQYSSTAIMSTFSAIQSAVLSLSVRRELSVWILKSKIDVFIVLYTGMIGTGLSFVGMSWCVKKRGPVFTAAFNPLVQIMAAMFDGPILHEQLHLGSVLGSVIVMAGLYILLWGKDKEMHKQEVNLVQDIDQIKDQEPAEFKVMKVQVVSEQV